MTKTYNSQQQELLRSMQIDSSGADLLTDWSSFVHECEEGYSWDYSEFLHELGVRRSLDLVSKSSLLFSYKEHALFCARLEAIDVRFRALLQHDVTIDASSPWWRAGVLIFAQSPYVDYIAQAHGIVVRRCRDE